MSNIISIFFSFECIILNIEQTAGLNRLSRSAWKIQKQRKYWTRFEQIFWRNACLSIELTSQIYSCILHVFWCEAWQTQYLPSALHFHSKMKHSKLVYSCKCYPKLVYTLGMVFKNSSYQEWTQIKPNNQSNKINQTWKVGRNHAIKPWKIWKAGRLKNFESCKLNKSKNQTWKVGRNQKSNFESWKIWKAGRLKSLES